MTLKARQYIPRDGQKVKMREWGDYTSRGIQVWAWLRVVATVEQTVSFEVLNGDQPTNHFSSCPIEAIQAPLGWESVYTIYCKPDLAQTIVSYWFTRGIVVRANHDMGSGAGSAFQPMDNSGQPHWKYPEVSDAIPPELCKEVFRVVAVEQEEITSATLGYPAQPDCTHCKGTGRRTIAELASIRGETAEKTRELIASGAITIDDMRDDSFRCHCHYGALGRMGRTRRAKLFKEMRKDGWEVKYVPYAGGFWERRRETVIHETVQS
jgi:hypothetical protein